jgi:cytochrome c oxidase assembly factor CtaG
MLELIPLAMTLVALAGYGIGLYRLRRRGIHWPVTRVAAMFAGSLCVAVAVLPPIASHDELFPVHAAVDMHMFLAGCLFSWAVIGIDPVRRRPGAWVRLTALVIAAAGHDTLAKLIYASNLSAGGGFIARRHTGAELMYYGGTVIEVALATVVMAQWYLVSGRALARTGRRSDIVGATADNRTVQPALWPGSTDSSIRASRGLHPGRGMAGPGPGGPHPADLTRLASAAEGQESRTDEGV